MTGPAQQASDADDSPAQVTGATSLSCDPVLLTVEARAHGWRLDQYLTRIFPNYSRALFQKAIGDGSILVNGLTVRPARRLRVNDQLSVKLPQQPDTGFTPENIPLDVLYEDDSLVVINKPAALIVHPGRGNYSGTMTAALQYHFDQLSDIAGQHRPGIVHRLDRDTSGVIVVAKDNQVHYRLSRQFERREVTKEYTAIVRGSVEFESDYIETWISVDPKHRERMRVATGPGGNSREANTFYEVAERFGRFTLMRLMPRTGRTHQLRVHMQFLGHPIVADKMYGGGKSLTHSDLGRDQPSADTNSIADAKSETLIQRQALHARRLAFDHPENGKRMEFEAPLPDDMNRTLQALRGLTGS